MRRWLAAWGGSRLRFEIEHAGRVSERIAPRVTTRVLPAADVVWLGSAPTCQLVLQAPEIAPQHLSISTQHGKLFVRDHSAAAGAAAAPSAIRRLQPPVVLPLGPYRISVALVPFWTAQRTALSRALRRALGRPSAADRGGWHWRLQRGSWLTAAGLLALGLVRALLHPSPHPPIAAAACGVDRAALGASMPAGGEGDVSVLRAVQLLRAGRKAEALVQYRALSARDDSPAALAVVTGLLEYELACPR